jgi:hypothetical protein
MPLPDLRFALPLASEARWSDLLAVLIASDPAPLMTVLDVEVARPERVRVLREVAVDSANQPDLVLVLDGRRRVVIEVKVLAGLGWRQLERYSTAVPDAEVYAVIFPQRLVIDVAHLPTWRGLTWEQVLCAYSASADQWVETTARAWLGHLDVSLPRVDRHTRWNALTPGEDFVIALRARMSWLHGQLRPPAPIEHDLVSSAAGVSWVVRLFADAAVPGYQVLVEVEEYLPVRDFPKSALPDGPEPRGPSVKVFLAQNDVETSAGYDWDYLLAVWPAMCAARSDWVTNPARPRAAHDRSAHRAMIEKGGPSFLGIGFGNAQAIISKSCMFGARIQLDADIELGDLLYTLTDLYTLIREMADIVP